MKVLRHRGVKVYYDDGVVGGEFLVTGFRGFGLVGYLATVYLVEKLDCRWAGAIVTRYMPEAVSYDRGRLVSPFEIMSCLSNKLILLVNHDIPHERERTDYAEAVAKWAKEIGVGEMILVGGFDSRYRSGSEELRWLSTSASRRRLPEPTMDKGLYVVGPLALLVLFAELYRIPALVILPYADASRPDPRAAAVAVKRIASIVGFEIDVGELLEEARKIEELVAAMEKQKEAAKATGVERVYM